MLREGAVIRRAVTLLLWAMVGAAKTAALVLLVTAADTRWPDAAAWLALAFGLAAAALWWRERRVPD
ncbi:MAG: hypothetical protein H7268_16525 [Sandarakinorhabdus sp.]|nr:hypothetical protein [Sandarakinorhabdus sp.]